MEHQSQPVEFTKPTVAQLALYMGAECKDYTNGSTLTLTKPSPRKPICFSNGMKGGFYEIKPLSMCVAVK